MDVDFSVLRKSLESRRDRQRKALDSTEFQLRSLAELLAVRDRSQLDLEVVAAEDKTPKARKP